MDRKGIGTDATIAEHIKKILYREYVTKNATQRFQPTDKGLVLVEGYEAMGYHLEKVGQRRTKNGTPQNNAGTQSQLRFRGTLPSKKEFFESSNEL